MKAIGTIFYEVDLDEIKALPVNFEVMQVNLDFGIHRILKAQIDYFPAPTQKVKYYIFKEPPLPELRDFKGDSKRSKANG